MGGVRACRRPASGRSRGPRGRGGCGGGGRTKSGTPSAAAAAAARRPHWQPPDCYLQCSRGCQAGRRANTPETSRLPRLPAEACGAGSGAFPSRTFVLLTTRVAPSGTYRRAGHILVGAEAWPRGVVASVVCRAGQFLGAAEAWPRGVAASSVVGGGRPFFLGRTVFFVVRDR